jgi:hypothetical protein
MIPIGKRRPLGRFICCDQARVSAKAKRHDGSPSYQSTRQ